MDPEKSKQCITKNPELKKAFGKEKLFAIRRLVRSIKQLSAKKGTTQQLEKNKRKVSRMEKELEAVKDLHVDMFIKAASAKTRGDDLNPRDFMSEEDEEDVARKMMVLTKIISAVGLDNIRELSQKKEEKDMAVKSSSKERPKPSVSSKTCSKSILNDDKELDIVSTESKEDKELDDFFTDPVVKDYNAVDTSQGRAHKKRKLEVDDSDKAFDSVFMQNLKGEKGMKKGRNNSKGFGQKQRNRLGQRERRKLWEKLYGYKANHLKKQKKVQEKSSKRDGKESRRNDMRKQKFGSVKSSSLHPSWQASKSKRKQESIVAFKGQKIIFED